MKATKTNWILLVGLLFGLALSGCSSLKDAQDLYRQGNKDKALDIAIGFLGNGKPEVRMEAAQLVGQIGGDRAGKALLPLMRDEVADVAVEGIKALGKTGYVTAGEPMTEFTPKAQGKVFDALAGAFRNLGTAAIVPLVKAFDSAPPEADWKAYRAMLIQTGPVVSTAIAQSFKGKSPLDNEEKLNVLVELRSPTVPTLLVEMLGDPEVADMVVKGLIKRGSLSVAPAVAELQKYQGSDQGATIKEKLCYALGEIKSRRAVPILEQMAKDSNDLVRAAADSALTKARGF